MITFCEAIARQEGWLNPSSRCRRNHNPGNLNYSLWEKAFGATLESGPNPRFAVFPTDQQGFDAMSNLLIRVYVNLTVAHAIARWAPSTENDVQAYVSNVCEWTGLTPSTVLTTGLLHPPQIV